MTPFLRNTLQGKNKPVNCSFHCIVTCNFRTTPYCIADALLQAQIGNLDDGFAFSGSNAYRIEEIISVEALFNELIAEYQIAEEKQ